VKETQVLQKGGVVVYESGAEIKRSCSEVVTGTGVVKDNKFLQYGEAVVKETEVLQ
jgi:hypothetical protein